MNGPDWSFRDEMQSLLDDPSTDFSDAVIILPKMRRVTHDSPLSLTALGVLEWVKASLCRAADEDYDSTEGETHTKVLN